MAILNGQRLIEVLAPVTVAASPLLTPWVDTTGCTQALGVVAVAGGTSVVTLEYSSDGTTVDADFTGSTLTPGVIAPFVLGGPYVRCRVVQTVGDATKTKIYLQARL